MKNGCYPNFYLTNTILLIKNMSSSDMIQMKFSAYVLKPLINQFPVCFLNWMVAMANGIK